MNKLPLITEDDHVEYKNYDELSYLDEGNPVVILSVDNTMVGYCKVWKDSEMENREYLTINHEIIYLDTIIKNN